MVDFVVFDDDLTFREMLRKGLLKHGLHCAGYGAVDEFIESKQEAPEIFIVDLSMPDPTGVHWEFGGILNIARIREIYGSDTPIWVLTGYEDTRIERECLRHGADKVILKREGVMETAGDVSIHWTWRKKGNRRSFQ